MVGQLRVADVAEEFGGEHHAIVVHDHADAGVGPGTTHICIVALGIGPEVYERRRWILAGRTCGYDVFTDVLHVVALAGNQGTAFEPHMAHILAVDREGSAILAQVFAMFLGQAIKPGVALEFWRAVAAAVRIDFLEDPPGEGGIRIE